MLDSLGRDVGNIKDNVAAIKAQMLQDIGNTTKSNNPDKKKELDAAHKLNKQLDTIIGYKLDEELKKFQTVLEKIAKCCEEITKNKEAYKRQAAESGKIIAKAIASSVSDVITKAAKSLQKGLPRTASNQIGGSSGRSPIPGQPGAVAAGSRARISGDMSALCRCICNCMKQLNRGGGGGGGTGGGGTARARNQANKGLWKTLFGAKGSRGGLVGMRNAGRMEGAYLPGKAAAGYDRLNAYAGEDGKKAVVDDIVKGVSRGVGGIVGGLTSLVAGPMAGGFVSGFSESLIDLIFKPLSQQFENMSQRASLIYSQIGSGAEDAAKRQQDLLFSSQDILETGVSLAKLEKQRNKNAQKGITDAKTLKTVTKSGLQLSSQIGSNAENTADLFADWNLNLGLSGDKLSVISRNMLTISRQTGLTGDNLIRVAKQSENFMTSMRNAGTFTAGAANNIIGLLAHAEKTGNNPAARDILNALQGSILNSSDQQTNSLLFSAAAKSGGNVGDITNRLVSGTALNDKATTRALGQGILNQLSEIISAQTGGRKTQLSQLTPEEAGRVTLVTQSAFKKGAREMELAGQNLVDSSKSFGEQMEDIDKKVKDKLLTQTEAQNQKQDLTYNAAAAAVSDFNTILKRNGGDTAAAFAELRQTSTDLDPLLKKLGSNAGKGADAIGDLAEEQYKQIKAGLDSAKLTGKLGGIEVSQEEFNQARAALRGGNAAPLQALTARFDELQRRVSEEKRATTDPAFAIQRQTFLLMGAIDNKIAEILTKSLPELSQWLSDNLPIITDYMVKYIPDLVNGISELVKFATKNFGLISSMAGALLAFWAASKVSALFGVGAGGGLPIAFTAAAAAALYSVWTSYQGYKEDKAARDASLANANGLNNSLAQSANSITTDAISKMSPEERKKLFKGAMDQASDLSRQSSALQTEAGSLLGSKNFADIDRREKIIENVKAITETIKALDEAANRILKVDPSVRGFTHAQALGLISGSGQGAGRYTSLGVATQRASPFANADDALVNSLQGMGGDQLNDFVAKKRQDLIDRYRATPATLQGEMSAANIAKESATFEASLKKAMSLSPTLNNIDDATTDTAKSVSKGDKPGSFFTHDVHVESVLDDILDSLDSSNAIISTMMPGMNVEEEIKKRRAGAGDDSSAVIEANTSDTADNTRRTNILLGALLNIISRSARRRASDTPVEGEIVDDSVFFDQFIDTEWVDSIARMAGNTWSQGNIGKHN